MKKIIFFLFLVFLSCESDYQNTLVPKIPIDIMIDLNLPKYINLQSAGSYVYILGGHKGIFIKNTGIGNPSFKAFDRICPLNQCTTPMNYDGGLKLTCTCDKNDYSVIDGAPQNSEVSYYATEYRVIQHSENTLQIINF